MAQSLAHPTAAGPAPAQGAPHARRAMSRWEALALLMVLAFLNYMDRHLIFPLQTVIEHELGLSKTQIGALATGFYIVYALAAPSLGYLSDRFSRKTILLASLIVWSIVTALSGMAVGFFSLLVLRSLTGLGEGGYFPTAVSIIGDLFKPSERGTALALHGVCTTLGGSAGYAVGGFVGERLGWRAPFFMAVVPGLILAVVIYRRFREPPRGTTDPAPLPTATPPTRPYLEIVLSPRVLLIAIAACFGNFATQGLNTYFPQYLSETRGFSVTEAGTFTGLFYAATLLGQLGGGLLSDRLATRVRGARPLLVAASFIAIAPVVLAIPHVPAILLVLVCFGVAQIGRGFAEPNIYGTIIDALPPHERGSAQGFLLMLTFAGASSSTLIAGSMIGAYGYRPTLHALAAAAGLAGVLAAVLYYSLRRRG